MSDPKKLYSPEEIARAAALYPYLETAENVARASGMTPSHFIQSLFAYAATTALSMQHTRLEFLQLAEESANILWGKPQ